MRKIRVTVEILDPRDSTEYVDLPPGWDDWDDERREAFLQQVAVEAQENHIGSGAEVVELDEKDGEVAA